MAWTERYVRSDANGSGDGTTDTNSGANGAWTLAQAISSSASGQRVNIKAGTYANTTTGRTLATSATSSSPLWWRGFNTTIGDIDSDNTLTKPSITFTTGVFTLSGLYVTLSNLSFLATGNGATAAFTVSGSQNHVHRCRFEHQSSSNASNRAFVCSNVSSQASECWFKATSAATSVVSVQSGSNWLFHDCVVTGGTAGFDTSGASIQFRMQGCIVYGTGGNGVKIGAATSAVIADRCTFHSCGDDGIEWTVTPTSNHGAVTNCIFSSVTGYGINNSGGANTAHVPTRMNNAFYSCSLGQENGFGDMPNFGYVAETSSPFLDAAGADFRLVPAALSRGVGSTYPFKFENLTFAPSLDIGAVQHADFSVRARSLLGM